MLCAFVKCAMVLAKRPQFLLFSIAQVRNEYSPQLSKLLYNYKLKKEALLYLKGLSEDWGRADFSKKPSSPLSLMKTYRMSLISVGSILLDSTFKTTVVIILLV